MSISTHCIDCFVAMAFGREDCDRTYFQLIRPTLLKLKLNPIRVDRRQHRDDLNNFIIRMLNKSAIVLADLTYARPSVYYEAGFAERVTPVVYTVRTDHLGRAQQDDNLRVHFDLQMKKIIHWSSPSDSSFRTRLMARMNYLLRPLLSELETKERETADRHQFASLSVHERCEAIIGAFTKEFRAKRFWSCPLADVNSRLQYEISPAAGVVGAKLSGQRAMSVTVVAAESITQKHIRAVLWWASGSSLTSSSKPSISLFDAHVFFCSLTRIPVSRLTAVCPSAVPVHQLRCFHLSGRAGLRDCPSGKTIWLLGSISSEREAMDAARKSMSKVSPRKTNKYTCLSGSEHSRHRYIQFERLKKLQ